MYIFGGRGDRHSPFHTQEEIYCDQLVYLVSVLGIVLCNISLVPWLCLDARVFVLKPYLEKGTRRIEIQRYDGT